MVDEKPTESKEGSGCRCPLPYVVSHIHEVSLFLDDQTNEKATSVSYFFRHIDGRSFPQAQSKCLSSIGRNKWSHC